MIADVPTVAQPPRTAISTAVSESAISTSDGPHVKRKALPTRPRRPPQDGGRRARTASPRRRGHICGVRTLATRIVRGTPVNRSAFTSGRDRVGAAGTIAIPTMCPACQSPTIAPTARNRENSYWRRSYGEIWNPSRREGGRSEDIDGRNGG